jgi:hypothetical protein
MHYKLSAGAVEYESFRDNTPGFIFIFSDAKFKQTSKNISFNAKHN